MDPIETPRLRIREMDAAGDAAFVHELLNTPKFIKYIGDRGVRSRSEAALYIEDHYRRGYAENGFGLYAVELRHNAVQIGICGFVRRETLPAPDIGFAFLPEFEGSGFGYESASAMLEYGRAELGLSRVLAVTTPDNDASGKLLEKLGFTFLENIETGTEMLRLYEKDL